MIIKNYTDNDIRNIITRICESRNISKLGDKSVDDAITQYLNYTPLARQILIDYYSQLKRARTKNTIIKIGFEQKYFYVGQTDVIITLILLNIAIKGDGHDIEAYVTPGSMNHVAQWDRYNTETIFEKYDIASVDINISWGSK